MAQHSAFGGNKVVLATNSTGATAQEGRTNQENNNSGSGRCNRDEGSDCQDDYNPAALLSRSSSAVLDQQQSVQTTAVGNNTQSPQLLNKSGRSPLQGCPDGATTNSGVTSSTNASGTGLLMQGGNDSANATTTAASTSDATSNTMPVHGGAPQLFFPPVTTTSSAQQGNNLSHHQMHGAGGCSSDPNLLYNCNSYQMQKCLGLEECKFVMLVWHDSRICVA